MRRLLYSFLIAFSLLISGCSNAGKDQTVQANTLVTLDGSASQPSVGGEITAYRWHQIRGKKVRLSDKRAVSPTFMAPDVKKRAVLVFKLTTIETGGRPSKFKSHAYVTIVVIPNEDPDTVKPVITLNGDQNITISVGKTYTEQGATATDDRDGTVDVVISGEVDTTTVGTYTRTYTATDSAGNTAVATRVITVIPVNHAPTANNLSLSTRKNNAVNANLSAQDSDDDALTYTLHTMPDHGILTGELPHLTYTPDAGYVGQDRFTFTATDEHGASSTEANVTINVIDSPVNVSTITGQVTDINGTPIENATVSTGEQSTTTDSNGTYTLSAIPQSERLQINVSHPSYLVNNRITPLSSEPLKLNIKLDAPKAQATFSSESGTKLTSDEGAAVELPAGGYVDANGAAYTGDVVVKMSYHRITTLSGRATFPGTFEGIEDNTTFPIQSFGFMNVELTDPQGNPLNLDGHSSATLTYPADNNLPMPATIPLWYYDTTKGYWVEEGSATRSNDYKFYIGIVTHFTSWNLDAKGPRARFNGCVEDLNGDRVANASVQFRSANWDSYIVHTDENGTISVINIMANTSLTFSATTIKNNTIYSGSYSGLYLNEGETKTLDECVVLKEQSPLPDTITIRGRLMKYDYKEDKFVPEANTDVIVGPNNEYEKQKVVGKTDADGYFDITFKSMDTIIYRIKGSYDGRSFQIQANQNIYDLGEIEEAIVMQ